MKWTVTLSTLCLLLSGCEGVDEGAGGTRTFQEEGVPLTFEVDVMFTEETVDDLNSAGDVIAGYGLSKVDVIALRRIDGAPPEGPQRHEVLGKQVTSELHRVADGYALECQYTEDRAADVREACADAIESVKEKQG